MRLRLDTLFGRLFGVLLLAIVLAHLLAFAWFSYFAPPPPPPGSAPEFSGKASSPKARIRCPAAHRVPGSAAR